MTESTQYERDLRSANKEWRRGKDSAVKWSHGRRHLTGISFCDDGRIENGATAPEHMWAKSRPEKRPDRRPTKWHHFTKTTYNIAKPRSISDMPSSRRRAVSHAQTEIDDAATSSPLDLSLTSPTVPSLTRTPSASTGDAGVLYSFDRADTPGRPLTLEVFVKNTSGKETERLVEKEYEVLDGNGEAVRGRRARAVLRKGGSVEAEKESEGGLDAEREVEGGFELV
ncbi:hypothetical protein C8A01DRAFT_43664 [Parachaetomium inaequale]|uniref:Uncharacterized protein n=1 Tax=Parachaetomium inaequale TaxID=2588326 RepID=A0AAN6PQC7_9PEZI|nr:hypothetical protein C8A01DRAFT_43664 [Parachaetomium inaequale]